MSRLDTLFFPFEAGLLEFPGGQSNVLVLGAEPGIRRHAGHSESLVCIQGFRPSYLALQREGLDVRPSPEGDEYTCAFVLCGRFRAENEQRVAEALKRTREGGLVVIAGAKTDGVASIKKRVSALVPILDSQPKYHGIVFWVERPADPQTAIDALSHPSAPLEGGFLTGPGTFSADGIDPGSRLLADNLPGDLKGAIADFGAGWGYLSARLAGNEAVSSIDLFEASHAALEAARTNLAQCAPPSLVLRFFWHDLLSETVAGRYDAIVMNPPFHQGRAAEPDIGAAMIRAALGALKRGGRLFMVANRGLPYDEVLGAGAVRHGELARDQRYRILWAAK